MLEYVLKSLIPKRYVHYFNEFLEIYFFSRYNSKTTVWLL